MGNNALIYQLLWKANIKIAMTVISKRPSAEMEINEF